MSSEAILGNARIVTADSVILGAVRVAGGRIADIMPGPTQVAGAQDLDGDYLLPGLVEIHTDNMEKHFEPRPGALWPSPLAAVLAHDAQVISAGITTVLDAVCVGDYRDSGKRRRILGDSISSIATARAADLLRADHLFHLRCEISDPSVVEMFEPYADHPLLRLVSVMDHTPGQRQWRDLESFRTFHRDKGWNDSEFADVIADHQVQMAQNSEVNRKAILDLCRGLQVPLASHDDTTEEHVEQAHAEGIGISEFPTTLAAARLARSRGMINIMGAPNVVRGGSHSGNISAMALAEAGLLDVLSSDYVPASLLHAGFLLHQHAGMDLPDAVRTVALNPARAIGLDDRGEIVPGRRADLVRVRLHADLPIVREVWRGGARVA
jgi:alpha-D-ribose 1-methylphosphonate 5-triphosphate diphosphatase